MEKPRKINKQDQLGIEILEKHMPRIRSFMESSNNGIKPNFKLDSQDDIIFQDEFEELDNNDDQMISELSDCFLNAAKKVKKIGKPILKKCG